MMYTSFANNHKRETMNLPKDNGLLNDSIITHNSHSTETLHSFYNIDLTNSSPRAMDGVESHRTSVFSTRIPNFSDLSGKQKPILWLLRAIQSLSTELESEKIVENAAKETCHILNANKAFMFMYDQERKEIWSFEHPSNRCPSSRGLIGFVARTAETISLCNSCEDPRFDSDVDQLLLGAHSKAILGVPVIDAEHKVVGVLVAINTVGFSELDQFIVEMIANQVAICLRNAQIELRRKNLEHLSKSFLEILSPDLSQTIATNNFVKDLMERAQTLVDADRCSVFVHDENARNLWALDSCGTRIQFPTTVGIAGYVARTGELLNVPDAYQYPGFNRDVDQQTGYRTRSIMCAPIKGCDGRTLAVAAMVNKRKPNLIFSKEDESIMSAFCALAGLAFSVHQTEKIANNKTSLFLGAAQTFYDTVDNVGTNFRKMLNKACEVLDAERCSIFLLDRERNELWSRGLEAEIRFPANVGVAGYVASTGELVNVTNAYDDARFNPNVDVHTGFKTMTLLVVPIRNTEGRIVGVFSAVNKRKGKFTKDDEQFVLAFSVLNGLLASRVASDRDGLSLFDIQSEQLDREENVVTIFDQTPDIATSQETESQLLAISVHPFVRKLSQEQITSFQYIEPNKDFIKVLETFEYDSLNYNKEELMNHLVFMFVNNGYLGRFNCSLAQLTHFVELVRHSYNNNHYHNFFHAVDVVQELYATLCTLRKAGQEFMTQMEEFALLVAALCHDLDHPGLNNAFLINSRNPLAVLYNDISVLENYHTSTAFILLSKPESDVFIGLNDEEKRKVRKIIVSAIMATDMAHHNSYVAKLDGKLKDKPFSKDIPEDRQLMSDILLKSADLAHLVRPWNIAKKWEDLVQEEFFCQGDLEKQKEMPVGFLNDREKVNVPASQIFFYEKFGDPLFHLLSQLFPSLSCLRFTLLENRDFWKRILEENNKSKQ